MKSSILALTGILMSLSLHIHAGEADSLKTKTDSVKPVQVTFITPLGTNGHLSHQSTNNISLNILAGYNGGLEGVEVGGIANVLKEDMEGVQVAGVTNIVRGNVEGIQVAGIANLAEKESDGIMISGFTNHAQKGGKIVQVSGFSNQSIGKTEGAQIAGFCNATTDSTHGVQVAGFANFSGSNAEQVQLAGFANCTKGNLKGLQVSGFSNHSSHLEGAQITGFLNRAKAVSGLQLGFINVADSFNHGVPIGFFSHVNHGYRGYTLQTNELAWVEFQYRTGVDLFHNIFAVAASPLPENRGWSVGYGIGSTFFKTNRSSAGVDLIAYHVNEDEVWTNAVNNLIRLSGRYTYHPSGGKFGITAGPSINLHTNSTINAYGEPFESTLSPYEFLSDEGGDFRQSIWAGAQVGITF